MNQPLHFGPRAAQAVGVGSTAVMWHEVQTMLSDFGEASAAELSIVLSAALALQHVHHTHHWQTRGPTSYADHLLFQRLYEGMDAEVDGIAEKAVGLGGYILVQPLLVEDHKVKILKHMYAGADAFPGPEDMVSLSLRAENGFVALLQVIYRLLEAKDGLTMGADDMLQAMVNLHEEHLYLLQQRGFKQASLTHQVAARMRG